MDLNRRGFLKGLAAAVVSTGVVGKVAAQAEMQPIVDRWVVDTAKIFSDYTSNIIIYGVGALQTCSEYPYIRCVDPREILQDDEATAQARSISNERYGKTLICAPKILEGLL